LASIPTASQPYIYLGISPLDHLPAQDETYARAHEGIVLNVVTLMEVAHYFRHLPKENFRRKLDTIKDLATLKLISLDLDLAELAFEQLVKYAKIGIGGRDSIILATMKATGTKRIASHDKIFKKIEDLEVIDTIP
jgi:predicted nucleic acid-binding protein